MQSFSLGAGLAAMAFWGFIAAVVVAGIWYDIRKREAQQETVRRLIESGQAIDDKIMDKLLSQGDDGSDRLDRGFKVTGIILLPVAVGLAVLGTVLGMEHANARLPLYGVAGLVACVGVGFFIAAAVARRWYVQDNGTDNNEI